MYLTVPILLNFVVSLSCTFSSLPDFLFRPKNTKTPRIRLRLCDILAFFAVIASFLNCLTQRTRRERKEARKLMQNCIIYVMGVSGSGKTTVGEKLAEKIALPFFDADDFHSAANKQKMTASIPLTDEDRQSWLNNMNQAAREQAKRSGAVFACSALKKKYRTVLSSGISIPLYWVFLKG